MAKLTITVDLEFQTNKLRITDKESFEEVELSGAKAAKFFQNIQSDELEFEVVSTNPDGEASFPFKLDSGKSGAVFNSVLEKNGNSLEVVIKGQFGVDLKPGVAKALKAFGQDLDLRIRGVMWKGGAYRGFMASVAGSDFDQESENWASTFPSVESFLIK